MARAAFAKLQQKNSALAQELEGVCLALEGKGASAVSKRIEMAAERADILAPAMVYQVMDIQRLSSDLSEIGGKLARRLSAVRNSFALLPLLFTWLSLALATIQYQSYIAKHAADVTTPFLILWERGFGGATSLTFSATAGIDVFLLALILGLTIWAHREEGMVAERSRALEDRVDTAATRLATAIARGDVGPPTLPVGTRPEDWARHVDAAIQQAMTQTETLINAGQAAIRDVANEAQRTVQAVGKANEDLIRQEMQPLVASFRQSVTELSADLTHYQQSVATISATINQLSQAAGVLARASQDLAQNSGLYTSTAASIDQHIQALGATQQQFVAQVAQAAQDMSGASTAVQQLANQISGGMVNNLARASKDLQIAENALNVTTRSLAQVAGSLDTTTGTLSDAARTLRIARLGWLGILFGRSGGPVTP